MDIKSILLTTYPEAFVCKGGGEYELLEVALNLRKLGLAADIYGPYAQDMAFYDVLIHFSVIPSGLEMLKRARELGKKIILWPNFWLEKNFLPQDIIHLSEFLKLADLVVFKSKTEQNFFCKKASLENSKVMLIPAGVDPCFANNTPQGLFKSCFNLEKYILWIGIIEPLKKQLEVISVLRELQIPIVFIGNYRDKEYYDACRSVAPDHFLFLNSIEHKSDLFRASIRECALYIEPTEDPAGKSALEAGISGAKILLSDTAWSHEHFADFAIYVDHKNMDSLYDKIMSGIQMEIRPEQTKFLSEKHLFPNVLKPLLTYFNSK